MKQTQTPGAPIAKAGDASAEQTAGGANDGNTAIETKQTETANTAVDTGLSEAEKAELAELRRFKADKLEAEANEAKDPDETGAGTIKVMKINESQNFSHLEAHEIDPTTISQPVLSKTGWVVPTEKTK